FWHIPWPPFPVFRTCPWAKEILEGMVANNLIGFHLKEHCINFLSCVEKILELPVDYKKLAVAHDERRVFVKNFPISIDFDVVDNLAKKPGVKKEMEKARSPNKIPYKYIGVGVDRIDYTKGIIERFKAIDRFLEKYPQYQNNFVFVEAGAPSRTRISSYATLNDEIEKLAEEINWKYQMGYWRPIKYIQGKLGYNELLGLYRTADVCIVSSLHDGMNLVAKEFIAANVDRTGVLLLSRFAGAADELKSAVIVNPFDIEGFADAINKALKMPVSEKKKRMILLRNFVKENNIYKWVYDFISEAGRVMER
ncbi:MAG: trehalose-6-phosphate synthase, partial [Euryarchaeota archaeon CG01_land_8_20_14_3_00_38_12]